jgi:hypothetical protein
MKFFMWIQEMNRLKKIATWIPLIPQLKNLHNFHVIIQTLNTTFLYQHYEDINHDHNLQIILENFQCISQLNYSFYGGLFFNFNLILL